MIELPISISRHGHVNGASCWSPFFAPLYNRLLSVRNKWPHCTNVTTVHTRASRPARVSSLCRRQCVRDISLSLAKVERERERARVRECMCVCVAYVLCIYSLGYCHNVGGVGRMALCIEPGTPIARADSALPNGNMVEFVVPAKNIF